MFYLLKLSCNVMPPIATLKSCICDLRIFPYMAWGSRASRLLPFIGQDTITLIEHLVYNSRLLCYFDHVDKTFAFKVFLFLLFLYSNHPFSHKCLQTWARLHVLCVVDRINQDTTETFYSTFQNVFLEVL